MSSVVIHSDSGTYSTLYARAAGIIETLCPGTDAVDADQGFEHGDVQQVSAYLFTTVPFWPDGTVFVSLVGDGEPVAVRLSSGSVIICPNNGTVTVCADSFGIDSARRIDNSRFGEDIFSMVRCAAVLASGEPFESAGSLMKDEEVVLFKMPAAEVGDGYAEGEVIMLLTNFGNITFSIKTEEFETTGINTGDAVRVTFRRNGAVEWQADMTYQPSFGYVPEGAPVVFNGSSGYMDIGLNRKNFIKRCIPQILETDDPGEFKVRIEKIDD